jgi:hypothetical protein
LKGNKGHKKLQQVKEKSSCLHSKQFWAWRRWQQSW